MSNNGWTNTTPWPNVAAPPTPDNGWPNATSGAGSLQQAITPWTPPAPVQQQAWPIAANQPLVKAASTNPYDAMSQDQVLMEWQRLKKAVEDAKEAEMDMRKYIVGRAFPQAKEGTNTLDLGNGYQLKAGVKLNYTLDPDLQKVESALDDIHNMGNEGAFLATRLVKWSADFLLTEYRALELPDATDIQKQIKRRIDQVLTITNAAPSLEIKEPKAKKK